MTKLRISLCAIALLGLGACGFHLRRGAQLPSSMQKVHLSVSGGGDLERELARALETSGATLVDAPGPGVAEFRVTQAQFRTEALTFTGHARVGEYEVRYHVEFQVDDSSGQPIVVHQHVDMSREFTYDAQQPVGTEAQTEEIHDSMQRDMVEAIQFRLRAAAEHPATVAKPATTASTQPAPARTAAGG